MCILPPPECPHHRVQPPRFFAAHGTSCPQALSAEVTTLLYDTCAFMEGWIHLMVDAQTSQRTSHPAGSVGDTTPLTFGNYPADPAWGTALPTVLQVRWWEWVGG